MKSLLISLVKKNIKRLIGSVVISALMLVLNWIGTFPDVPFIFGLFLLSTIGVSFLFFQKLFVYGKLLIVVGMSLMLILIVKNSIKEPRSEIYVDDISCDHLVRKLYSMDSIGWKFYNEGEPEMLAYIGCCMLEDSKKNENLAYKIPLIEYADSLLTVAGRSNSSCAYYYAGRAIMRFYGLGCEKSIKDGVLYAKQCLKIQNIDAIYFLLEEMKLDSTEYHDVVEKVRLWRDSIDNINVKGYQKLTDLFIPKLSRNNGPINMAFYTFQINQNFHSVLDYCGIDSNEDSLIKRCYYLYESVYHGDTSSVAWKTIENNMSVIKMSDAFDGLLAAYYWGKTSVDSAHVYCNHNGSWFSTWNQLHDFNKFEIRKENLNHDIMEHIDDVLHYSDLNNLVAYKSLTDDSLLKYVLDAALQRREHRFLQNMDNNTWNIVDKNLSLKRNKYLKQLRPHVK